MQITILAGEYLRDASGRHIMDDRGFAIKAEVDTDIDIGAEVYDAVLANIQEDRVIRGMDPVTGLPPQDPE